MSRIPPEGPKTFVDRCMFSPTGFAFWRRDSSIAGGARCTCNRAVGPATYPEPERDWQRPFEMRKERGH